MNRLNLLKSNLRSRIFTNTWCNLQSLMQTDANNLHFQATATVPWHYYSRVNTLWKLFRIPPHKRKEPCKIEEKNSCQRVEVPKSRQATWLLVSFLGKTDRDSYQNDYIVQTLWSVVNIQVAALKCWRWRSLRNTDLLMYTSIRQWNLPEGRFVVRWRYSEAPWSDTLLAKSQHVVNYKPI